MGHPIDYITCINLSDYVSPIGSINRTDFSRTLVNNENVFGSESN